MDIQAILADPLVQEIIEALSSWKNKYLDFRLDRYDCEEILENIKNPCYYRLDSGASRIVISHPNWDFVIKIDHAEYENFGACKRELHAFQEAKKIGIEDFLLPIAELIDIGLPNGSLYVQQRAEYLWNNRPLQLCQKIDMAVDSLPADIRFDKMSLVLVAYLVKYFGEEFVRKVLAWSESCGVNDLHGKNCGFVGEAPKLLDYAGFWE